MGKKIGTHQFVQDFIAQMVADYETSRLLVWKAAWAKNQGVRNTRETSLAKWIATEAAFRAAHNAIQIHGAMGFDEETGIARFFRNSRAPIIYEGTTQIHKMMQAEHALGWRELNGKGAPSDLHRAFSGATVLSPHSSSERRQVELRVVLVALGVGVDATQRGSVDVAVDPAVLADGAVPPPN